MGKYHEEDEVEVDVTIRAETDKAYLVFDGKLEVWLPKSQILVVTKKPDKQAVMTLPEWLATDKGLT